MIKDIYKQRILVLDFGSQYTQLIARRIREIGVYCEVFNCDVKKSDICKFDPKGIILSGGPDSVGRKDSLSAPEYIFSCGIPIFGICYGMHLIAKQFGGKVMGTGEREFGHASIKITNTSSLFKDLDEIQDVWMSHADQVVEIPVQFAQIAQTDTCFYGAMADEERRYYGVQFHPEVTHTKNGIQILKNFVVGICGCERKWKPRFIIDNAIARIRDQVGDDEVVLALSGGVDSSVVAALLNLAIGTKLTCVFVDNGLLRLNESEKVMEIFSSQSFSMNIIHVSAENRFLEALRGKLDPEEKRKIIGKVFIDIFNEESKKLKNARWLAQGTIHPDVVESAASETGKAQMIKSHHNVAGLPDDMDMNLIEPLRELFKDEVRRIGLELGVPYNVLYRHPFPGPGLGVRILGEIRKEHCDLLRLADAIFIEELYSWGLYYKVSQAFAVFLPIRSVGIMGDARKYDWVISLRAIETVDFMTARWACLPYDFLSKVSNRIINEVEGISRVVYDISGKPPSTIEWE
ncbi:GMP synthase [Candidatus Photodesmus blepharus]|uniref:GMP synthase [glutamine-hydrolyzing] n=1 Tax=Candidatus Photodesmus blepharonis TaxID=1179155 RepID=A0A084CPF1_9GAMM|nr:glutamine-hydrolyzing GMP synthase [Candidatus Photodesmus blepharus]KEY91680.1 GMP synthase [Candidatus Photodesmus blepharus]